MRTRARLLQGGDMEIEYEITKIADIPIGGVHIEFEFKSPSGKLEKMQINFGQDMQEESQWRPHLEEYITRLCAPIERIKQDYPAMLGKKKIKIKGE